jgi:hypothetical protein
MYIDSHWNMLYHPLSSEQLTMYFKFASLFGLAILSLMVTAEAEAAAAAAASGDKDKMHGVRGLQGGISFPGGVCPAIPTGLVPVVLSTSTPSPPPGNDGWTLVDFCLEGGLTSPDCHYNDDESSSQELSSDGLSFSFSLFGTLYNKVFINNNGNLSFGSLFGSFTSTGFPITGFPMVAPFWADVDTRGSGTLGYVWKKTISSNVFAVAWDNVGYYSQQGDKRNTFMVLISDGNDSSMGIGNNICFCYEDMEWTTGSASRGVSGFGGVPATVGVNNGDGVKFSQIGRFNSPGSGITGIDLLDGQTICFSAGLEVENIPPVAIGVPVDLACDEAVDDLAITFSAPESDQTVTLTVTADPGVTVVTNDGIQTAMATINWDPK